jgi:formylglycine-generating enzyme required for sulfatase activity
MTSAPAADGGGTSPDPVFLSYASHDLAVATRIRDGLEQAGLRCWIAPRDIEPGSSFPAAITAAISSCRALVLLLTDAANSSPHVLSEVELAFNARKPIIAVLVGGVTPSADLKYFISTTHWFDAESSFDDDDMARLRADLERLLAGERVRYDLEHARRRRVRATTAVGVLVVALIAVAVYAYRARSRPVPTTAGATGVSSSPPLAPRDTRRDSTSGGPVTPAPVPPASPVAAPPAPSSTPRSRVNPIDKQTYMWIPPGRFSMGCSAGDPACEPDEMPSHVVRITAGLWLARTEVPLSRYAAAAAAASGATRPAEDLPATEVTWAEAKSYCTSIGGRLPTEAEWEYAARAGTTERYYDSLGSIAWYDDNSGDRVHAVAGKGANAFGLYDMLGNVYEWVLDRYYNKYDDTDTTVEEPLAANASGVARGGAWTSGANDVRVTNRLALPPDAAEPNVGFRCALNAE